MVATPIGNLQDISHRAREILASVDLILSEDTRHSQKLLQHFSITTPLKSCHEHNEAQVVAEALKMLEGGAAIALISDAGTPLISDPGYRLVAAVHDHGLRVSPVPGPSACISALSASGLPTDRFLFRGYLPAKAVARQKALAELAQQPATLVFYEAPHRIEACLEDAAACFGSDRPAALAREISKLHEEVYRSDLGGCLAWLREKPERIRGEYVLLVAGAAAVAAEAGTALRVLNILREDLPRNQAAALTAKITGLNKNELYRLSLDQDK